MQIIQKKSSKTLSILKSFQGSGTLFYKLFVFYIVNSNISCFCFYAVIMACKHTALYTNPASCFCLFYGRLRRFPLHTLLLLHNLQKNSFSRNFSAKGNCTYTLTWLNVTVEGESELPGLRKITAEINGLRNILLQRQTKIYFRRGELQ